MSYAIFRAEKIKSWGLLARSAGHMNRSRPTPNADPSRSNLVLIGSGDPDADVRQHISEAGIALDGLRKNGVLAVRILATASPEFFRPDRVHRAGEWDADRLDAWQPAAMEFLQAEFGDNLVSAIVHLDESTPHIDAIFVPLDMTPRNKGSPVRLNCARWFDGRKKLAALQDRYATALAPLGLERGVKGSRAQHKDIKRQYATLKFEAEAALETTALTTIVLQSATEDRRAAKSEKQAATNERAHAEALSFGLEAFADGRILAASGDEKRPTFELQPMPKDEVEALRRRLEPAWHAVWRSVRRLAALIDHRAQEATKRATERAMASARATVADTMRAARAIGARAERIAQYLTPEARAETKVLNNILKTREGVEPPPRSPRTR